MRIVFAAASVAVFAGPLGAQQHRHLQPIPSDSAFAAVQERGGQVMGVDQYTSRHVFEPLSDGGRIELQREVADTAGVARIRRHLAAVAKAFARGDFSAPFLVHERDVPGTRVVAAKRTTIRYLVSPLPRGGEIRITTRDPQAVGAVHEFLAFQRRDHRAGKH